MDIKGTVCDPGNVCSQISVTLDFSSVAGSSSDGYQLFAIAFSSVLSCFLIAYGAGTVVKIFRG